MSIRPTVRTPLAPGDAVGLLAAIVETPLLADLVPPAAFPAGGAMRALHHIITWEFVPLDFRAETIGGFRLALHERLRAHGQRDLDECLARAIDAARAWPPLLDRGRARLIRYAAGSGRLLEEPDAVTIPRDALDGLRLHGEAAA